MRIMHVVGARPNFMKVAPLMKELQKRSGNFEQILVHTGQHYDYEMSQVFFDELRLPEPNEYLGVGSGSHAAQTARVMMAFEPVVQRYNPDWLVVVGDVNSTLACALVCAKLGIPVAHIEAGLRSGDRSMPEEINRLLTDQIADLLFTPSLDADANLLREGVDPTKIHFVGNVMIDTLVSMLPAAQARKTLQDQGLNEGSYILVTLHRPSNVDDKTSLRVILNTLDTLAEDVPVIFPVHPRTRERITQFEIPHERIRLLEPQGYLDFLALTRAAKLVLTDSGGIQEETTYLGIPCLTLRPNTERPVTITHGTNQLVMIEHEQILSAVKNAINLSQEKNKPPRSAPPPLWDGKAAERIAEIFEALN